MKKLYTLSVIVLMLYIGAVSASSLGTFQKNQEININTPCYDEIYHFCNATVNCSLTIFDPDTEPIVINKSMSRNQNFYNFSLNSSHTDKLGEYTLSILCENTNIYSYTYDITPNGESLSLASAFFYIIITLILMGFTGLSIYGFIKTDSIWGRYALVSLTYILFIALSFTGWRMSLGFITSNTFISGFFWIIFNFLIILLFPFILASFIYYMYCFTKVKEIDRLIKKGMPYDEAIRRARRK